MATVSKIWIEEDTENHTILRIDWSNDWHHRVCIRKHENPNIIASDVHRMAQMIEYDNRVDRI